MNTPAPTDGPTLRLSVGAWNCWAPGCDGPKAWRAWGAGETAPGGEDLPDLRAIPALQRRRLSPVARAAFAAAGGIALDPGRGATVFISTFGQPAQSLALLDALAEDAPVSPAAFSLSVHNAVAGLFSIVHGLTGPSVTLGAGADGLGAAFVEAAGLIAEGSAREALVVGFEDALPADQLPWQPNPPGPLGAAFLIGSGSGVPITLVRQAAGARAQPLWEQLRELVCWFEGDAKEVGLASAGCTWTLRRA